MGAQPIVSWCRVRPEPRPPPWRARRSASCGTGARWRRSAPAVARAWAWAASAAALTGSAARRPALPAGPINDHTPPIPEPARARMALRVDTLRAADAASIDQVGVGQPALGQDVGRPRHLCVRDPYTEIGDSQTVGGPRNQAAPRVLRAGATARCVRVARPPAIDRSQLQAVRRERHLPRRPQRQGHLAERLRRAPRPRGRVRTVARERQRPAAPCPLGRAVARQRDRAPPRPAAPVGCPNEAAKVSRPIRPALGRPCHHEAGGPSRAARERQGGAEYADARRAWPRRHTAREGLSGKGVARLSVAIAPRRHRPAH